ncbi:CaiB/BaiF CoA transferase family protein [Pseudosulfitobacter pseudonitzschiae]|uniref:CoA-transferase n=2 Tax=Pseudosulfitobacter pseudonitzschiae TaxID=1402135 RepID=A0A073IZ23_9RHOB|nr:CaiB/BaiF CoA-transferase family protein [Pseudosulfitobacter pseudonitzschiae]KEJ95593.1 CoA-transferase [Pseudosulfitobacter pseudonitzschiae]MBM1817981.1 CoA transferase [Pseudosulfitobacter pseudonitzschiae]MBM1835039.1 CoA transferase [Pseudosulfitobacter pseudonitzschiae]MBM1839840.1 CoA transferase [Pseudosulfitobacter pseudonitzschiae]MBM1844744.1 CoA transferase [Pseudosulfitobacter pseudonitzschiae]
MMTTHLIGPLDRFRVLDLTRIRSGPTCVKQFADWGADVIKIEPPDDASGYADRDSSDFQNLHRNKRSLTLDLKSADGRDILMRLVDKSDVLVENFRPDVKKRLGLDWDSLHARNPKLVLGSISGFGQTGPYAERPGFDQVAQGMGGLMSVTGLPGQGPVRVGIPVADLTAGMFCATGILMALLDRERTGVGQWVQSSLLQAQVAMLDFQAARWLIDGVVPEQAGNNHPTAVPMGVYPTSDGSMNIAVTGNRMWQDFCTVIDRTDLADDARFATARLRLQHRDELNALLFDITRTRTSADLTDALIATGIPCGPINKIDAVFADPQVAALGLVVEIEHPKRGTQRVLGQPIVLSGATPVMHSATPDAGQHSDAILQELGLSTDEVAALKERKVV